MNDFLTTELKSKYNDIVYEIVELKSINLIQFVESFR